MEYIVGIDGGGTKTVLCAADGEGNPLCCVEGGTSNINAAGPEFVARVLGQMAARMADALHAPAGDCRYICMGAAGADRPDERAALTEILRASGYSCPIRITNDASIALWEGAGGVGIVISAGTGSICYGRNEKGLERRAGGWGHVIGDEGSAYGIAVRALNGVARSADGRDGPTALTGLILGQLGLKDASELIPWVYRTVKAKSEIARLAKTVDAAADAGDEKALSILRDAAAELLLCVEAVAAGLGIGAAPFPVVLSGSILLKSSYVSAYFREMLHARYPAAACKPLPGRDAARGAVLYARHLMASGAAG